MITPVSDPTSNSIHPPAAPVHAEAAPDQGRTKPRDACGCDLGARCMAIGTIIGLAWLAVRHGAFTPAFFLRIPLIIAIALVSAVTGKVIGMMTVNVRDQRETDRLVRAIRKARGGKPKERDRPRPLASDHAL